MNPVEVSKKFESAIHMFFEKEQRPTRKNILTIAKDLNIDDALYAYELAELAWTKWYKKIAQENQSKGFDEMLKQTWFFYKNIQPTFDETNTYKRKFQQYSTAAPVALCGTYYLLGNDMKMQNGEKAFEPSAGNGLLAHALPSKQVYVNEIDVARNEGLETQGFAAITNQDAAAPFDYSNNYFDFLLTNPPFGKSIDTPKHLLDFYSFTKAKLENIMCINALYHLKESGKTAMIVGGWLSWNEKGWIANDREYYNWLYRHFYVDDIININSQKLYNKQGTAFPLRMILLAGKKPRPYGRAPLESEAPQLYDVVNTIEELSDRVKAAYQKSIQTRSTLTSIMEGHIQKLKSELSHLLTNNNIKKRKYKLPNISKTIAKQVAKNKGGFILDKKGLFGSMKSDFVFALNVEVLYQYALNLDLESFKVWQIHFITKEEPFNIDYTYTEAHIFGDEYGDMYDENGRLKEEIKVNAKQIIQEDLSI